MNERRGDPDGLGEVLVEFRRVGAQVRVAAIHADTGTEVVVVAPATASQSEMISIARAKLARALSGSKSAR